MTNKSTTTEPRVCQRGVDGRKGCGHNEVGRHGRCIAIIKSATYAGLCGHRCGDFSPFPPIEDGMHEFLPAQPGHKLCKAGMDARALCNQPADALVHKVTTKLRTEELAKGFAGVRRRTSDFAAARKADALVHKVNEPFAPESGPPARVWITWDDCYAWETPETGGDEYARLAPIEAALAKCEAVSAGSASESTAQVIVLKSDWDALVKSVKGEK